MSQFKNRSADVLKCLKGELVVYSDGPVDRVFDEMLISRKALIRLNTSRDWLTFQS